MNLGWHIKPAQVFLRPHEGCAFASPENALLLSWRTRPCCPGEQSLVVGELILSF